MHFGGVSLAHSMFGGGSLESAFENRGGLSQYTERGGVQTLRAAPPSLVLFIISSERETCAHSCTKWETNGGPH